MPRLIWGKRSRISPGPSSAGSSTRPSTIEPCRPEKTLTAHAHTHTHKYAFSKIKSAKLKHGGGPGFGCNFNTLKYCTSNFLYM